MGRFGSSCLGLLLGLHELLDEVFVLQEDILFCIPTEESVQFLHIGLLCLSYLLLHSDSLVHICLDLEVLLEVAPKDNLPEVEPVHFEFFDSNGKFTFLIF